MMRLLAEPFITIRDVYAAKWRYVRSHPRDAAWDMALVVLIAPPAVALALLVSRLT